MGPEREKGAFSLADRPGSCEGLFSSTAAPPPPHFSLKNHSNIPKLHCLCHSGIMRTFLHPVCFLKTIDQFCAHAFPKNYIETIKIHQKSMHEKESYLTNDFS